LSDKGIRGGHQEKTFEEEKGEGRGHQGCSFEGARQQGCGKEDEESGMRGKKG